MQYSVIFLAALAATTTLAAPTKGSKTGCDNKNTPAGAKPAVNINTKLNDGANKITVPEPKPDGKFKVEFSDQDIELGRQLDFTPGQREEQRAPEGPFTEVKVLVADSENNRDNKCRLFTKENTAIEAVRDNIKTITFSDDGLGAWTLEKEEWAKVEKVVCDPAFEVVLQREVGSMV